MKSLRLEIIEIEGGEDSRIKGLENIFNKVIKENIPNLKKEMSTSTRSLKNIKQIGSENKILPVHNNQNTKCREHRKNV